LYLYRQPKIDQHFPNNFNEQAKLVASSGSLTPVEAWAELSKLGRRLKTLSKAKKHRSKFHEKSSNDV